jgi:hypothetical protein
MMKSVTTFWRYSFFAMFFCEYTWINKKKKTFSFLIYQAKLSNEQKRSFVHHWLHRQSNGAVRLVNSANLLTYQNKNKFITVKASASKSTYDGPITTSNKIYLSKQWSLSFCDTRVYRIDIHSISIVDAKTYVHINTSISLCKFRDLFFSNWDSSSICLNRFFVFHRKPSCKQQITNLHMIYEQNQYK